MNACSLFRHIQPLALLATVLGLAATNLLAEVLSPIFNGKDLSGWKTGGGASFEVRDGVILGKSSDTACGSLRTEKAYGDFILELEANVASGYSDLQIRSHLADGIAIVGYQIAMDTAPRATSGSDELARRGLRHNQTKNPAARAAFKIGEWNKYRIECVGASIKSWVNDVPDTDYLDAADLEGLLALVVASDKNEEVRFRNLRLQDLGRHVWRPAWNGTDFSQGHFIGKGEWKIEDGVIHATHPKDEQEFGHFVSNNPLGDFTVRLKYKAVKGNSGLYFRIEEKGATGVSGFQAEIDAEKDAGGLYETNGRAWVSQPSPADVKRWFKPQEWNTMTVYAQGRHLATDVNGYRAAELRDDPGRTEGHFALRLHGGQDVGVYFKDIEMLVKAE